MGDHDNRVAVRLAVRELHDNIVVTRNALTAWYVIPPVRWSFRLDGDRETTILGFARAVADLAGHDCTLRVTTRPHPARAWAERLDRDTPNPLPGVAGVPGTHWSEWLHDGQRALLTGPGEKVVFLGVRVDTRAWWQRALATSRGTAGAEPEIGRMSATIRDITEAVTAAGMNARPAATSDIEWLLHRSLRLGLPAPRDLAAVTGEPWTLDDMAAFTDGVTYSYDRWAPHVRVDAAYPDRDLTRYVSVLTVGRMPTMRVPDPERDPWLQFLDSFPWPVEVAANFTVIDGPTVNKRTRRKRFAIRNMIGHYREHDLEPPIDLPGRADHAARIEAETSTGTELEASRSWGVIRLAVTGATEDEVRARRNDVIKAYRAEQGIQIRHPRGVADAAAQFPLMREFWPGEPVSTRAYQRRLKTVQLAAGLPHAAAVIGDRRGPVIGHTTGASTTPVHFDQHYAMEHLEGAGLIGVTGTQGAGKSTLLMKLAHDEVKRGIPTTLMDPANLLGQLTRMRQFQLHGKVLDIVHGDDGSLSPYGVVADPVRGNYDTDAEWGDACRVARQSRKALVRDVAGMLLDRSLVKQTRTTIVLDAALRTVDPTRTASLWDVVEALRHVDEKRHGRVLADHLTDLADLPQSRLFFGNQALDQPEHTDTLLVVAMHGLQLPRRGSTAQTLEERMSIPILHLATHYGTGRVWGMPRGDRKFFGLDESGLVSDWPSGKAIQQQLARNTRKWNLAAAVLGQLADDLLRLDVAEHTQAVFVGRTGTVRAQEAALRLLGVPTGRGYEAILGGLSPFLTDADGDQQRRGPREFVMRDPRLRVERIVVDALEPELLAVADTTPAPAVRDGLVPA